MFFIYSAKLQKIFDTTKFFDNFFCFFLVFSIIENEK